MDLVVDDVDVLAEFVFIRLAEHGADAVEFGEEAEVEFGEAFELLGEGLCCEGCVGSEGLALCAFGLLEADAE